MVERTEKPALMANHYSGFWFFLRSEWRVCAGFRRADLRLFNLKSEAPCGFGATVGKTGNTKSLNLNNFDKKHAEMHFFSKKVFTGLDWGPITRLHRRGAALVRRRRGLEGKGLWPWSSLTL
ncbi:hypothetical protein [Thalassospira australica]|uniref:hypothetical protein n=1 Tax=Thalassospira australica TaxID=1528106 RepID=UPI00384CDD6F